MANLEELSFSQLLAALAELSRLGLIGELSQRLLYRVFITGVQLHDTDDEADALIDAAAARLIIDYDRRDILPDVAKLIFRRNRRGEYIHDLVWSFFHDVSAEALTAVAGYLTSESGRDTELACRLLHLDKCPASDAEKRAMQGEYLAWLGENRPFLYLTGEYFNYSSRPEAVKCDLEARYLHREILPKSRAPLAPLDEDELQYLAVFRSLPEGERELLAAHSLKLHRGDVHAWHRWLALGAAEQVMAAKSESEAVYA